MWCVCVDRRQRWRSVDKRRQQQILSRSWILAERLWLKLPAYRYIGNEKAEEDTQKTSICFVYCVFISFFSLLFALLFNCIPWDQKYVARTSIEINFICFSNSKYSINTLNTFSFLFQHNYIYLADISRFCNTRLWIYNWRCHTEFLWMFGFFLQEKHILYIKFSYAEPKQNASNFLYTN